MKRLAMGTWKRIQDGGIVSVAEVYRLNLWRDRARVHVAGLIGDVEAILHHNQVIESDGYETLLRDLVQVDVWLSIPFEAGWGGLVRGRRSRNRLGRVSAILCPRLRRGDVKGLLDWWR